MTDDASQAAGRLRGSEVDIGKQRLGLIYARALLGATEPRQQSETALAELDALIDDIFHRHPELEATLASPRIPAGEKSAMLDRIFGNRMSDEMLTFLKVVARRGRLDCLRQIRESVREEFNRLRNRVTVEVTTAEALNDELRGRIIDRLQQYLGQQIDLRSRVDPAVLGGLVVRVGDTVFDASVANRLAQLKKETLNKTSSALRESLDRFAVSG